MTQLARTTTTAEAAPAAAPAGTRVVLRGDAMAPVHIEIDWSDTVAGLARAALGAESGLTIDGVAHSASRLLRDIAVPRGATLVACADVVARADATDRVPLPDLVDVNEGPPDGGRVGIVSVEIVAGPGAGGHVALGVGVHLVGRHPAAAVHLPGGAVSARHAEITVRADGSVSVVDLGSRNGIDHTPITAGAWPLGSSVRLGDTVLRLTAPQAGVHVQRRPEAGTTVVPHRRGVRRRRPNAPDELPAPPAAVTERAASPLRWSMILLPLLMAGAMALLIDPRYAIFAALSPVMAIGSWYEDRRARRREAGSDQVTHEAARQAWQLARASGLAARAEQRWFDHPGPAAAVRRAFGDELWTTRPGDPGFGVIHVGVGRAAGGDDQPAPLPLVPLVVPLTGGDVVAIVGDPAERAPLLRAIIAMLTTNVGPDDLQLLPHHPESHDWSWLPHVSDDFLLQPDLVAGLGVDDGRLRIAIVTPALAHHPDVRASVSSGRLGLIVLADDEQLLSDQTSATVTPGRGRIVVSGPRGRSSGLPVVLDASSARQIADQLRLRQLEAGGADQVPDVVGLGDLLRRAGRLVADDRGRPRLAREEAAGLCAVMAATADGPFSLDLIADGPHVFIGGTTGAGKSELLRSLVLSLAVAHGPDEVQFVFVDFKGGATFDVFADLPHTLDIQTDLDGGGATRALTMLDAELRRREEVLRRAGAADIADMASGPARLVVIVDELAAFVATHDNAGSALADIAQRGRSLGVHLILATQRPAGAIGADVRANTSLRIALRTEDAADARDVVGHDGPATIDRRRPGRAWIRCGGEVTLVQSAHTSASSSGGCRRFQDGRPVEDSGTRELDELVALVRRAALGDQSSTRARWPAPLPEILTATDLTTEFGGLVDLDEDDTLLIGVRDDPHNIRRRPLVWRPSTGPLVVHGLSTSGAADVLLAVAAAVAGHSPDAWHLEAIDAGSGLLRPIGSWPHTAAVHSVDDGEALRRLVARLQQALAERRAGATGPRLVLLVDGFDRLRARHDDLAGHRLVQGLVEAAVQGAALGIHVALTTARPMDAPAALVGSGGTRLVMTLADATDHAMLGQRVDDLPTQVRGRGYVAGDGMHVQVIRPGDLATLGADAAERWSGVPGPDAPARLPRVVTNDDLPGPRPAGGGWDVPVGLDAASLEPRFLPIVAGEHLLIAGPARSGRTTLLRLVAARLAHPVHPDVVVITRRPEEWTDQTHVTAVTSPDDLPVIVRPTVLMIEDAGRVPDHPDLLAAAQDDRVTMVVTGRPGGIRLQHTRWLQRVRADRGGALLRPSGPGDAALFEAPFTGPTAGLPDGRGYLVRDGELLQTQFSVGRRP